MNPLPRIGGDGSVSDADPIAEHAPPSAQLRVGDVVLDRAAYLATVNGRRCTLARLEFKLLETLMLNADHVLSSKTLLHDIWGPQYIGDPGTVAVHILRLRKKIERDLGSTRHLRTIRGVGYIFDSTPL